MKPKKSISSSWTRPEAEEANMKASIKSVIVAIALVSLWLVDFSPEIPFVPVFVADADSRFDAPLDTG